MSGGASEREREAPRLRNPSGRGRWSPECRRAHGRAPRVIAGQLCRRQDGEFDHTAAPLPRFSCRVTLSPVPSTVNELPSLGPPVPGGPLWPLRSRALGQPNCAMKCGMTRWKCTPL